MKLRLIRHASLLLTIGEVNILVDPFFGKKDAYDPVIWTSNGIRNPMTELPLTDQELEALVATADMVVVTHTHNDHWDEAARQIIPKNKLLLGQPEDEQKFRDQGFTQVTSIDNTFTTHGLLFTRTGGQHGTGDIGLKMAPVSGFIISNGRQSVYIAGDTIWCPEVEAAISKYKPNFIVLNAGAAQFDMGDPITMTIQDIMMVARNSRASKIICVHMDTVNHCYLERYMLRAAIAEAQEDMRIQAPEDGETVTL